MTTDANPRKDSGTTPLHRCVRESLQHYLDDMGEHGVTGLYAMVLNEVERPLLETVLERTRGNLSQAARMLGMTRSTLRKKLKEHHIERQP